jgi:hypothetical protein
VAYRNADVAGDRGQRERRQLSRRRRVGEIEQGIGN